MQLLRDLEYIFINFNSFSPKSQEILTYTWETFKIFVRILTGVEQLCVLAKC